ncbi:MAG: hypothetical protein LAN37_09690 [Acidobacteriia bacterium]|nr:hypothetical protein [Terriglobia bacterium]
MGLCALLLSGLAAAQTYPSNYPVASDSAIPEGTRFVVRLKDKLDTDKIQPGKKFKAELMEDLVAPDGQTIPRGKTLKGHVSSVDRGLRAQLLLSFNEIETNHGSMPIAATVTGVPGEHGVKQETGPEGEINKRGIDKRRAAEAAAVGAVAGTAAGAAGGGGKGAAIGAAAGAGAGFGAAILTDRNITLEKGQQLELRLDRPLTVPTH